LDTKSLNVFFFLLFVSFQGAFSSVFKAVSLNPQNPQVVALKRIYFTSRPTRVENEIRFLLELGFDLFIYF